MYRGAGTGLIALGVIMAVVGAILDFAVTATTSGVSINTVGAILLIVGIVCAVIGGIVFGVGTTRKSTLHENVHSLPDGGQDRVVEQRDSL